MLTSTEKLPKIEHHRVLKQGKTHLQQSRRKGQKNPRASERVIVEQYLQKIYSRTDASVTKMTKLVGE